MPKHDDRLDLERLLEQAMAGPPAESSFRARLRRRIRSLHPAAVSGGETREGRRRPAGRNGRAWRQARGRSGRALAGVAAAAALVAVVLLARQVFLPGPLAEFGKLPLPVAGLEPSQGAAGGPGFTFDFSYRLGADLAGGWPRFPERELAYRLRRPQFTEEWVSRLASGLGIQAPVVREGWHDSYLLAADPGEGRAALRMFPNGYTVFTQPFEYGPAGGPGLPGDVRALALARQWLEESGFVPPGELGAGTVTRDHESGTVLVRFAPAEPGDVVTTSPFAVAQIGTGERIVMASATWYPAEASSPYPLRGVAQAWDEVESGRGVLEWAVTEYSGPVGEDNIVRGLATVGRVRLAWSLAIAPDGTPYLVPVYAFSGTVEVPGAEGPESLPFEVWAPAVTRSHTGD